MNRIADTSRRVRWQLAPPLAGPLVVLAIQLRDRHTEPTLQMALPLLWWYARFAVVLGVIELFAIGLAWAIAYSSAWGRTSWQRVAELRGNLLAVTQSSSLTWKDHAAVLTRGAGIPFLLVAFVRAPRAYQGDDWWVSAANVPGTLWFFIPLALAITAASVTLLTVERPDTWTDGEHRPVTPTARQWAAGVIVSGLFVVAPFVFSGAAISGSVVLLVLLGIITGPTVAFAATAYLYITVMQENLKQAVLKFRISWGHTPAPLSQSENAANEGISEAEHADRS